jgi:hypothetical protein
MTRRRWIQLILKVAAAGPVTPPKEKFFKPKFPKIPVREDYRTLAPDGFWKNFLVNLTRPGKPSLNAKQIKQWADAVGCSDQSRLKRVLGYVNHGADIG